MCTRAQTILGKSGVIHSNSETDPLFRALILSLQALFLEN